MVVILPRGLYRDWLAAPVEASSEFMRKYPGDRLMGNSPCFLSGVDFATLRRAFVLCIKPGQTADLASPLRASILNACNWKPACLLKNTGVSCLYPCNRLDRYQRIGAKEGIRAMDIFM